MKALHLISFVLLIIGGLNWLLVAFRFNLVESILGEMTMATMIVYILVGLSAIWQLVDHKKKCADCCSTSKMM